jgi:hypothetical protein
MLQLASEVQVSIRRRVVRRSPTQSETRYTRSRDEYILSNIWESSESSESDSSDVRATLVELER